jgi:hypothetical protein
MGWGKILFYAGRNLFYAMGHMGIKNIPVCPLFHVMGYTGFSIMGFLIMGFLIMRLLIMRLP